MMELIRNDMLHTICESNSNDSLINIHVANANGMYGGYTNLHQNIVLLFKSVFVIHSPLNGYFPHCQWSVLVKRA